MNFLVAEYEFNGYISNESLEMEKNINYNRFKEITDKLNLKNKSIVIMKKK